MTKPDWKKELRKRWNLWNGRAGDGNFTTCGAEVEEFIDHLLEQKEKEVMDKYGILYGEDAKMVQDLIDNPPPPNEKLIELMKGHQHD